ncbi:phospholipase D-like domain-containing protein [Haloarcula amylovorans]|uniref:phospholipase D-like domain-containing protein n=1 Tax=Haloarcula amylovorans TaxID=2562280 RepID=UPI001075E8F5|nr:phospholipase D-like domain-containing protein [Halomicroarcula amylolytica]
MRSPTVALVLVVLLVSAGPTAIAIPALDTSVAETEPGTPPPAQIAATPTIHAVYPDPIAAGDRGEFVVLSVPDSTVLGRFSLTDGHTTAELPNRTVSGNVVLTDAPVPVRNLTDAPVYGLETAPSLANGGDTVQLQRNGTVVSTVRYRDASEGELGVVNGSAIRWRPLGATARPVVSGRASEVRAFTLPDAPNAPLAPIRAADDRVLLAGYTLSSARVADALVAAQRRGTMVRVLLEGGPIGGRTRTEARTLDRLSDAGVEVRVIDGPYARYNYHHAKYVVADERAVVLTENWKPAGVGGNSSRGWGVATSQPRVVDGLVATFEADAGWRDAVRWREYRRGRTFERGERADATYPRAFEPKTVAVERTELLVTPDNAQRALVAELDAANDSIAVIQPTVGDWDEPLLRALRRAASRGIEVRLLLSSAWYSREANQRTVDRFEAWAERTDAPLSARLAEPSGRFTKIHAKGAVVDRNRVIVGSLNWNEQAATTNREVVLVLHGSEAATYFGRVFDADWSGGKPTVPLALGCAVLGIVVVAGLAARRVRFAS